MSNKITRKNLVKLLQEQNLTAKQAEMVLDTVLLELSNAFKNGTRVELRGFGSFTPKVRLGGKKRNPRTGEEVFTSDQLAVRFKLAKELRSLK